MTTSVSTGWTGWPEPRAVDEVLEPLAGTAEHAVEAVDDARQPIPESAEWRSCPLQHRAVSLAGRRAAEVSRI